MGTLRVLVLILPVYALLAAAAVDPKPPVHFSDDPDFGTRTSRRWRAEHLYFKELRDVSDEPYGRHVAAIWIAACPDVTVWPEPVEQTGLTRPCKSLH